MRRFYEQTLWILQKFLLANPDLHHGLLGLFVRDWMRFASEGAMRVLMFIAIISQVSIVIYALLQSKAKNKL